MELLQRRHAGGRGGRVGGVLCGLLKQSAPLLTTTEVQKSLDAYFSNAYYPYTLHLQGLALESPEVLEVGIPLLVVQSGVRRALQALLRLRDHLQVFSPEFSSEVHNTKRLKYETRSPIMAFSPPVPPRCP